MVALESADDIRPKNEERPARTRGVSRRSPVALQQLALFGDGAAKAVRAEPELARSEGRSPAAFSIPTVDVRDKDVVGPRPAVKGLVGTNGTLHPEHHEAAQKLIRDVNTALSREEIGA